MDVLRNPNTSCIPYAEVRKFDCRRKFRYFTLESLILLVCLTGTLLILPLVLPPLPPPPLMLLLVPILILALLMVLAFMPYGVRDMNHGDA